MNYLKTIVTAAIFSTLIGCYHIPDVEEKITGPYVTVCVESFNSYDETFNIIDSLKNELKPLNVPIDCDFAIIYERISKQNKPHSIVGCILKQENIQDSTQIIKLIRNNFMVQTIGKTKSMVITIPFAKCDTTMRKKVFQKIETYIKDNNYLQIPNGANGVLEIYRNGKATFAAEIRPSR